MTNQQYYQGLLGSYLMEAKALIPEYDKMINTGVDLLVRHNPKSILDVGLGVGNVERIMLRRMSDVTIIGLEPSTDMWYAASHNLADYNNNNNNNVQLKPEGVLEYEPKQLFDAIYSNSVLHNLNREDKQEALHRIFSWLNPGGLFIWGDFVRHGRKDLWEFYADQRKQHGLQSGEASDSFIEATFRKEFEEDTPLTVPESLETLTKVGFKQPEIVWMHDTFAVFYATKPEES